MFYENSVHQLEDRIYLNCCHDFMQVGIQQIKGGDSSPGSGIGGAEDRRRTNRNRQKVCKSAGCDYKPKNWLGNAQNNTSQEIQQAIRGIDRQSWATC